jgi:hypothetical protein
MEQMFDGLFSYENSDKLDEFTKLADKETAFKMIEMSLMYCQQNGVFTMEESFLIYKMLNKLKE